MCVWVMQWRRWWWWWWNRWISYLFLPTAIKRHWMEGLVWWIRMDGWLMYVNPYPYWTNKRGIQGLQVATSTLAPSGNNWKLRFAQLEWWVLELSSCLKEMHQARTITLLLFSAHYEGTPSYHQRHPPTHTHTQKRESKPNNNITFEMNGWIN